MRLANLRLPFAIGAAVVLALGALAYALHRTAIDALVGQQQRNNVAIAHAVANTALPQVATILQHPAGASANELRERYEVAELHAALRKALRGTEIVKAKVYALSGMTVYSSDRAQIGESKRDNEGFQRALLGEAPSTFAHRDQMNLFEGRKSDLDIVATYVPYRGEGKDAPKAVVEVYADVTALVAQQRLRQWLLLAAFVAAVAAMGGVAFVYARRVGEAHRKVEREAGERRVRHQAYHDAMTGLPNRANFLEHLGEAVARGSRDDKHFAIMMMDVDRFKLINESLGHKVGDRLLRRVARRVRSVMRKDDQLFRVGGDEFALLLWADNPARDAAELAQRVLAAVAGDFQFNERTISVTLSIGVTVHPDDATDAATLVRHADSALDNAKSEGGARVAFFTGAMSERAGRQLELEAGLRRALKGGEFEIYYQPRYDARDRRVVGVEALLRWRSSAESKFVPPDEFVPVLEDTGLVVPVGRWVLQRAARQAQRWQQEGHAPIRVSVNVSPRQFHSEDFVETVRSALRASDLAPHWLELELTERLLCEDTEQAVAKMQALKRLGVVLSIDDFGTGYSSLAYLQRFPIDFVKIDKSFVHGIAKSKREAAIALAIIDMAHNLQIRVVAEGVEHEDQAAVLRDRGCHELQGFLFSRPLSVTQVTHRLGAANGRKGAAPSGADEGEGDRRAQASPEAIASRVIAEAAQKAAPEPRPRPTPSAFMATEFSQTLQ